MAHYYSQGLVIAQLPALTINGRTQLVHSIIVTVPLTNTGNVALGVGAAPVLATHVNAIAEFTKRVAAGDTGPSNQPFELPAPGEANLIDPTEFWVTPATGGEGLICTYSVV